MCTKYASIYKLNKVFIPLNYVKIRKSKINNKIFILSNYLDISYLSIFQVLKRENVFKERLWYLEYRQ